MKYLLLVDASDVNVLQSDVIEVQEGEGNSLENDATRSGTLRVALICGGPSAERGISLNSARSVLDHLEVRAATGAGVNQFGIFVMPF